jgi:hypothetical protein
LTGAETGQLKRAPIKNWHDDADFLGTFSPSQHPTNGGGSIALTGNTDIFHRPDMAWAKHAADAV